MTHNITEYERPLDNEELNLLRVRFTTLRGRIVSYMVQYETTVQGRRFPVVRYDTSHGRPHRDRMYLSGRREKLWPKDDMSYNKRVDFAIDEIGHHWERYREEFFRG